MVVSGTMVQNVGRPGRDVARGLVLLRTRERSRTRPSAPTRLDASSSSTPTASGTSCRRRRRPSSTSAEQETWISAGIRWATAVPRASGLATAGLRRERARAPRRPARRAPRSGPRPGCPRPSAPGRRRSGGSVDRGRSTSCTCTYGSQCGGASRQPGAGDAAPVHAVAGEDDVRLAAARAEGPVLVAEHPSVEVERRGRVRHVQLVPQPAALGDAACTSGGSPISVPDTARAPRLASRPDPRARPTPGMSCDRRPDQTAPPAATASATVAVDVGRRTRRRPSATARPASAARAYPPIIVSPAYTIS